jgi:hypothetical protein
MRQKGKKEKRQRGKEAKRQRGKEAKSEKVHRRWIIEVRSERKKLHLSKL